MKPDHISLNAFAVMACGMMLCLESVSFAYAGQTLDPTEQLRPFADKLISIFTDPDLQGEEMSLPRREKAMKVASERIDFKEMSKRVLGKTWRQLNLDEKENFVALFTQLVEYAYIGKIEGYSKQKVEFKDQRIKGKRAQVNTSIVDTDNVISVSYIMLLNDDKWMVYDIVVEGVSLVRNYMEQFKEILRKDSYASLVKQVEDKITELEQGNG
jgi:phospholipid transport system substrate-binding protein